MLIRLVLSPTRLPNDPVSQRRQKLLVDGTAERSAGARLNRHLAVRRVRNDSRGDVAISRPLQCVPHAIDHECGREDDIPIAHEHERRYANLPEIRRGS